MDYIIEMEEYQAMANTTAIYSKNDYPFLGLGEEAGEVLGKLAKHGRKNGLTLNESLESLEFNEDLYQDLVKELGDVLWMLSQCADAIGTDINHIAQENLNKLRDRQNREVLEGSGDNR